MTLIVNETEDDLSIYKSFYMCQPIITNQLYSLGTVIVNPLNKILKLIWIFCPKTYEKTKIYKKFQEIYLFCFDSNMNCFLTSMWIFNTIFY